MTELEYAQLELDAITKAKAAALAQKSLQDANFAKQQAQVDARITALQAKIAALQADRALFDAQ